jgi:hypothetical protein
MLDLFRLMRLGRLSMNFAAASPKTRKSRQCTGIDRMACEAYFAVPGREKSANQLVRASE